MYTKNVSTLIGSEEVAYTQAEAEACHKCIKPKDKELNDCFREHDTIVYDPSLDWGKIFVTCVTRLGCEKKCPGIYIRPYYKNTKVLLHLPHYVTS